MWSSALRSKIEADPYGSQAELKSGKYDSYLNNSTLIQLRGEADSEIKRLQALAEAQRKENERQVGKLVSDYKEAKMSGFD